MSGVIYLLYNNQREGPYSVDQIQRLIESGSISSITLAWKEGMPDWEPLNTVLSPEDRLEIPAGSPDTSIPPPPVQSRNQPDDGNLIDLSTSIDSDAKLDGSTVQTHATEGSTTKRIIVDDEPEPDGKKPTAEIGLTNLEEHKGVKCTSCDSSFYKEFERCPECGGPTESNKWYGRLCIERIAFIVTISILIAGVGTAVSDDGFEDFFGIVFGLMFAIFFCYFLTGFFGFGRFTERFLEGEVPDRAYLNFSWRRFFTEFLYGIGIVIFALLLGATQLLND